MFSVPAAEIQFGFGWVLRLPGCCTVGDVYDGLDFAAAVAFKDDGVGADDSY